MRAKQITTLVAAFVLSHALQLVAAHGDEEASPSADIGMDMTTTSTSIVPATMGGNATNGPVSYFSYGSNSSWMVAHAGVLVLAWVFILPIGKQLIQKGRRALGANVTCRRGIEYR